MAFIRLRLGIARRTDSHPRQDRHNRHRIRPGHSHQDMRGAADVLGDGIRQRQTEAGQKYQPQRTDLHMPFRIGNRWLLIAAWLYKAAFRAKMHSMIWLLAVLAGNLAAVVVFLVLRNIFRVHCSQCGEWCRKGRFCTECGSEFSVICPACGAQQPADQKFCGRCGAGIPEKNDSKSGEDTDENSENAD